MSNGRTDDDELMRPFEDSEAFVKLRQDRVSYNAEALRLLNQPDSHASMDSSLVSQIEQDKKKIKMLQQDLLIEKEHNAELNK